MKSNLMPLVRTQVKLGLSQDMFGTAKKKKANTSKLGSKFTKVLFMVFLVAVIGVPYGYMAYEMMQAATTPEAQAQLVQNLYLIGLAFCFIGSMTTVPTTHFFSNNSESYMAMPVKENEVSIAMVIGSSIQVYVMALMMMSGMVVGYLIANFSVQALFGWIIALLFMPIVPIVLVSIIFILLIRFIPALHSKYRLQRFTTVFTMVATLALVLFLNNSASGMMESSMPGFNTPIPAGASFSWYLPMAGAGELVALSFVKGLLFQVISLVVAFALLALITRSGYFAIIQTVQGSGGKKLSMEQKLEAQGSVSKTSSVFKALFRRELKTIWSTPAYMMNGPLANLIVPIIMVFSLIFGFINQAGGIDGLFEMVKTLQDFLPVLVGGVAKQIMYGALIGFGTGFSFGAMNSLSATAFSRDAKHLDTLLSLPIRARDIIIAKLAPGIVFSFIGSLLMLIPLIIVSYKLPILFASIVITHLLGTFLINELGLLLDFKSPKLNWDDELRAIKGNSNAAIVIFLSFALVGFSVAAFFVLPFTFVETAWLVISVIMLVLVLLTLYLFAKAEKLWHGLSVKL